MLKFNITYLVLTYLLGATIAYASPAREFSKSIVKEFDISSGGLAGVTNKYGDIDVRTWNASKVKIEVTIKVEAKNQETANGVFDRISIEFENSASAVRARTEIEPVSSWKKWFDWGSSDEFKINYVVWVPAALEIELDNKYGDIFISDKQGRAGISLKYGDMRIGQIKGNVTIDLAYADGVVGSVGDAELDLSYSDLSVTSGGSIELTAKYSDIKFGSIGDLNASTAYTDVSADHLGNFVNEGKYDDFVFGSVASVESESKYVGYKIGTLSNFASFEVSYGSIRIDEVSMGFDYIDINTSYTDVSIDVADGAEFKLEAETRYCDIRHYGMEVTKEITKNQENMVNAWRGSTSSTSRITASMSYGGLVVR